MFTRRLPLALFLTSVPLDQARAAGTLDRLRAVSRQARERAGAAPEHLWAGVALAVVLLALVAGAVYWSRQRKKS